MNKDIILEKPVDFVCSHCHCISKITVIKAADAKVRGRYEEAKNEYMKYAGRADPECMLKARQYQDVMYGNTYDYWIACPICHNRAAKFKMGEEVAEPITLPELMLARFERRE